MADGLLMVVDGTSCLWITLLTCGCLLFHVLSSSQRILVTLYDDVILLVCH
jgi:hypothetical protein